jgi:WhiB family redox-sensing transcriptional regulator
MANHQCGSRGRYHAGCRCDRCTRANAIYAAARKRGEPVDFAEVTVPATPRHDLLAVESPDWVEHAECRGAPVHVFFPEQGESTAPAKAICARCQVSVECLAWALDHREHFGVWGGTSERERRRMRPGWQRVAP